MKKILVIVIVLVSSFLMGILLLKQSSKECAHDAIKIAILTPTTHPALEEIEQGFKETLLSLSDNPYCFKVFNANGNKTLLRAQAEEIASGQYQLVLTIGAGCSQTIAELLTKKNNHTPHIFTAIDGLVFAQSLAESNTSSTGAYVTADYKKEVELLHTLKPAAKNILLVYDPTQSTGLEHYKREIAGYCTHLGMMLHAVEVYQANEIQQKVGVLLPTMDAVLVLIDNTVVAGIDGLVTLCNRYGVTLIASDLASGKKGAAVAYGVTEYESGSSAAHMANDIITLHKTPSEVSLRAVDAFRLEINKDTMDAQRLVLTEEQMQTYVAGYHD